jgi:hypothetical protein
MGMGIGVVVIATVEQDGHTRHARERRCPRWMMRLAIASGRSSK